MKRRKRNSRRIFMPRGIMPVLTGWALLFALLIRIPTGDQLTVSGQGYFSVALEWFLLFLIPGMGGLFHAVSRMVSLRIEKGSTQNAKKVVAVALMLAFLTGILITAILYFGAAFFAGKISGIELSVPALQCLAAAVLPLCLIAVLMGGLDGFGFTNTAFMPGFAACILFLILGNWLSDAFRSYGDSVGALLQNEEFGPAYAAFGCAVGMAVSSWAGFLAAILGWIYKKRSIHVLALNESGIGSEPEKHMMRGIIHARLVGMLTIFIPILIFVLQDLMYQNLIVKKEAGGSIREWGIYSGVAGSILTISSFAAIGFGIYQLPGLRICFERRNLKKSRSKLLITMRAMVILTIPCAVFTAILAKPVIGTFFPSVHEEAAVTLLRTGSFMVILIGLATALGSVLWSMRQEKMIPLGLLVSGIVMLLTEYLLLTAAKMGIQAVMAAGLVGSVVLFLFYFGVVIRLEKLRINWIRVFLPPCIGVIFSGLVCFFLAYFLGNVTTDIIVCLVSFFVSVVLYFVAEIALHGINRNILQEYPGGEKIYAVAHLLRLM